MKRRSFLAGTAAAATAAAAGVPARAQADKIKAGFIYVGPITDMGYNYQHNVGREDAMAHYGDALETVYVENVPEGPDCERILTQLCLDGCDIIFSTSFGFMDPTINVAAKFPDVKFEHATGFKTADNVAIYNARFYEGRAVCGHIAGKLTKTNQIGYIVPVPIPEVIMGINAAFIAARKVNPDVQFKIIWIYEWHDPQKEADAAKALIEQGCDVLMQHTDSNAPITLAEELGIHAFGQAADMSAYGPNACVTSIVDNWGPYYIERIGKMFDGTWQTEDQWLGMPEDMIVLPEINDNIGAELKAEAEAIRDAIIAREYHPFTGPLNRQDGTEFVAEGEVADDETLLNMMFFVEGMDAQLPS